MIAVISAESAGGSLGAALTAAADDPHNRVIVVSPRPDCSVPEERLVQLLLSDLRIGVVVAGAGSDSSVAFDVGPLSHPWVAFRRDLLAGRPVAVDLDPHHIAELAVRRARAAGLRIVCDPLWVVAGDAVGTADPEPATRPILVVTDALGTGSHPEDLWTRLLVEGLAALVGGGSLTVATLEGSGSGEATAALGEVGVEVVAGPRNWRGWLDGNWGRFEYVFVTRGAMSGPIGDLIDLTQPQAVKVLALDALPFRWLEQTLSESSPGQEPLVHQLSRISESLFEKGMNRFGAVVCARSADADYVRAVFPPRVLLTVPDEGATSVLRDLFTATGRGITLSPPRWPAPSWPAAPSPDASPAVAAAAGSAPGSGAATYTPEVAVIVSTRDGGVGLEACISSIIGRTAYRNFAVLVADNDSRDRATLSYLATAPVTVVRHHYSADRALPLDLAAVAADSEVLLFLADDVEVVAADWIEQLLRLVLRPEVGVVSGEETFALRSTIYGRVGPFAAAGRHGDPFVDLGRRIAEAGFEIADAPSSQLLRRRAGPALARSGT